MGIKGLLIALKPLIRDTHISQLAGKRVAVDGYCWLHKALYGCCVDVCRGKPTTVWMQYCTQLVDLLLAHNIHITLVFDGADLPMKAGEEEERRRKREMALQEAEKLTRQGDHNAARNFFVQAVNVTPLMAAQLIAHLQQHRPMVQCLVAPYEADAQLSYLSINNLVDVVISEDSDLIPYGCKDIVFKLDRTTGSCQRLVLADLSTQMIEKFDLRAFTREMLRCLCVLSGCDYLDSIKGMGLKKSHKLVHEHRYDSLLSYIYV